MTRTALEGLMPMEKDEKVPFNDYAVGYNQARKDILTALEGKVILKEEVLNYVDRCLECVGGTVIRYDGQRESSYHKCDTCNGKGLVIKGEV